MTVNYNKNKLLFFSPGSYSSYVPNTKASNAMIELDGADLISEQLTTAKRVPQE